MEQRKSERVYWIDVAKFFGIFAIYLGHFMTAAGKSYPFVFTHHVPLFFLISGCTENFNHEKDIGKYIIKKLKSIMFPFWLFSLLSIIVQVILNDSDLAAIKEMLVLVGKGTIRNSFFAGGLWFLTCLFVMQILFFFIKQLKKPIFILAVCIALFLIAQHIKDIPSWVYNIDSAFQFIIFYAIGFVAFPAILKLFELNTKSKKVFFILSGMLSFLYSALLFEGINILGFITAIPVISYFSSVFCAVSVIWLYFVVARLCENVPAFYKTGKNTLYLCGNEWIVKKIILTLISILGLKLKINSPLSAYLYTGFLLWITNKYFIPIEKEIIQTFKNFFADTIAMKD